MRESAVEKYLREKVEDLGGFTRKWTSPGRVGVEDQICFFPGGVIWFIEVKQHNKKPTGPQWREIMEQRLIGHNAGYLAGQIEVAVFMNAIDKKAWMHCHVHAHLDVSVLRQDQLNKINAGCQC